MKLQNRVCHEGANKHKDQRSCPPLEFARGLSVILKTHSILVEGLFLTGLLDDGQFHIAEKSVGDFQIARLTCCWALLILQVQPLMGCSNSNSSNTQSFSDFISWAQLIQNISKAVVSWMLGAAASFEPRILNRLLVVDLWVRFADAAYDALQHAAEAFLVDMFEEANLFAHHAKRITLQQKDWELVRKLREKEWKFPAQAGGPADKVKRGE